MYKCVQANRAFKEFDGVLVLFKQLGKGFGLAQRPAAENDLIALVLPYMNLIRKRWD